KNKLLIQLKPSKIQYIAYCPCQNSQPVRQQSMPRMYSSTRVLTFLSKTYMTRQREGLVFTISALDLPALLGMHSFFSTNWVTRPAFLVMMRDQMQTPIKIGRTQGPYWTTASNLS